MMYDQSEFDIRCEWGAHGVRRLAPSSDAIIIVDILSFSTCVTIATSRGAIVFLYAFKDDTRFEFARSMNAELACPRGKGTYSLSSASLLEIAHGTRLVLPSPNGSTLSLLTGSTLTFVGCLRNRWSVAETAMCCGKTISVIPAGERWQEDGSLRPALEDWVGAGAIIAYLTGRFSPEAQAAVAVYRNAVDNLLEVFKWCNSGQELIARGYEGDIALAAQVDVDACVPMLQDGAYVKTEHGAPPDGGSAALHPHR